MSKTHLKVDTIDYRSQGQTDYEHEHNTACGYVRENVSRRHLVVDCYYCLRIIEKERQG